MKNISEHLLREFLQACRQAAIGGLMRCSFGVHPLGLPHKVGRDTLKGGHQTPRTRVTNRLITRLSWFRIAVTCACVGGLDMAIARYCYGSDTVLPPC